jgi:hypothetical protein
MRGTKRRGRSHSGYQPSMLRMRGRTLLELSRIQGILIARPLYIMTHRGYRAGLANHLRSMPHSDFMLLLQDIYLCLLNGVEGLQEQGRVVLDILASIDS